MGNKVILMSVFMSVLFSCSCNKKTASETTNEPNIIVSKTNNLNGNWKLVELKGKKIDNEKFNIQFFEKNRFSAFAGCNNMGGEYEISQENKIKFSKVISTMMACDDMKTEQELASVLEMVDNFVTNGNTLSLSKAKMAPLARFEFNK